MVINYKNYLTLRRFYNMSIGAALLAGTVVSGVTSLVGGKAAGDAAKEGIEAVEAGTAAALAAQRESAAQTRADLTPYRDIGQDALYSLADRLGIETRDAEGNIRPRSEQYGSITADFEFEKDPGYEFRRREGEKSIQNYLSSTGQFLSGTGAKALAGYGQEFASGEFGKAYERKRGRDTDIYNYLANLAGGGQSAATQTGQLDQVAASNISNISASTGNQLANLYGAGGQARRSSYEGAGRALTGGISDIASLKTIDKYLN